MEPKTPWQWVYTVEQAAQVLQISPNTCREALNRGELPGRKVLGQWRISVAQLTRWLEERPLVLPATTERAQSHWPHNTATDAA